MTLVMRILRSLSVLSIALLLASTAVLQSASAAGKIKVKLTPERIKACKELLERSGMPLPPGAQITSISITAEDWVCTSCDAKVSGLPATFPKEAAKCDNCGSPMEPVLGAERYGATEKEGPALTLRDDQIDAALTMGANWSCEYCGTGGNRDQIDGKVNNHCQNCGADRTDRSQRADKNTIRDPELLAQDARKTTTQTRPPEQLTPPRRSKLGTFMGAGLAAVLGTGAFTYVTLQDTAPLAVVQSANWIQTARVEQFRSVIESAPRSEIQVSETKMPVGGTGENSGARILECNHGVCSYETYRWIEIDSKVKRGTIDEPVPDNANWAKFVLPGNSRIMSNTRFDVDVEVNQNGEVIEAQLRPRTYQEFRALRPGMKIRVTLDEFRNLVGGGK